MRKLWLRIGILCTSCCCFVSLLFGERSGEEEEEEEEEEGKMQEGGYSAKNGAKDSAVMRGPGAEAGVSERERQRMIIIMRMTCC